MRVCSTRSTAYAAIDEHAMLNAGISYYLLAVLYLHDHSEHSFLGATHFLLVFQAVGLEIQTTACVAE